MNGMAFLAFVGLMAVGTWAPFGSQSAPIGQSTQKFDKTLSRTVQANYLLYLPENVRADGKKWPLILYLHGGRGRGDDLEKVMWYPIPKMLRETETFPFIVITPQCPTGEMWTDTELLVALLDDVTAKYPVDTDRVYLVGYSMGGHGAWYLAYKHPERFAAVAPMSGMSNPWWATRLKDVPVWAFHGGNDDVVPVRETEEMAEALEKQGGNIKVTIVPDRTHRPPMMEEHEQLFDWLLKQRLSDRKGE
jgi:predicted peptidase